MVKKYKRLSDSEREELIKLIHSEGLTIKDASRKLNIPYPNAKAVNSTYVHEKRTAKKTFRFRLKVADIGKVVERKQILISRDNPFKRNPEEIKRRTCSIMIVKALSSIQSRLQMPPLIGSRSSLYYNIPPAKSQRQNEERAINLMSLPIPSNFTSSFEKRTERADDNPVGFNFRMYHQPIYENFLSAISK